jgi:hypothetical protein
MDQMSVDINNVNDNDSSLIQLQQIYSNFGYGEDQILLILKQLLIK